MLNVSYLPGYLQDLKVYKEIEHLKSLYKQEVCFGLLILQMFTCFHGDQDLDGVYLDAASRQNAVDLKILGKIAREAILGWYL